jgi:hypothetical protein
VPFSTTRVQTWSRYVFDAACGFERGRALPIADGGHVSSPRKEAAV